MDCEGCKKKQWMARAREVVKLESDGKAAWGGGEYATAPDGSMQMSREEFKQQLVTLASRPRLRHREMILASFVLDEVCNASYSMPLCKERRASHRWTMTTLKTCGSTSAGESALARLRAMVAR